MSYVQLVQPNLATQDYAGWCLHMQENVYSTPHLYATAEVAWNASQFPHPNEQPPTDVSTLVYWTYYDVTQALEFGHIASFIPGRGVFSSPFDKAYGNQWFASIQATTDRINQINGANSRYLGWSEDLAGVKIIGGSMATDSLTKEEIISIYTGFFDLPDDQTNQDLINAYTGKPLDGLLQQLHADPSYQAHYAKVNNPPQPNAITLYPGLYEVK